MARRPATSDTLAERRPELQRARPAQPEGGDERRRGPSDGFEEIYVSVGRRDGARASDYYTALEQGAGLGIDDIEYVRVLQRHTFVAVPKDRLQPAVRALDGHEVAGRVASAEPARPRHQD